MKDRWEIHREIHQDEVQYTVDWSPWGSMDRWVINRMVPSEAGLFQLWLREDKNFFLRVTEPTYFGGLRNSLREVIDELAPSGRRLRLMLEGRECRFRFSVTPVREYLEELKEWFDKGGGGLNEDGLEILVHESEDFRLFPAPPPDVKFIERKEFKDSDFGPPLPGVY
ncbi:MAG: hypothetical protein CSA76_02340 [Spirochaetales bacterium]|nr:MAG: hypothetical protein CSA76_02340 [Spirochaetales bacterium]